MTGKEISEDAMAQFISELRLKDRCKEIFTTSGINWLRLDQIVLEKHHELLAGILHQNELALTKFLNYLRHEAKYELSLNGMRCGHSSTQAKRHFKKTLLPFVEKYATQLQLP
jgi:hypothetical protein